MNDQQKVVGPTGDNLDTGNKHKTNAKLRNTRIIRFRFTFQIIGFLAIFIGTFALGWIAGSRASRLNNHGTELSSALDLPQIVERIITIESKR